MNRSLIISSVLHGALIFITAMSLPFLAKKPLDIPPIVSVELIQIAEKTNIPFAPKAKKIIEKKKKKKLKEKEKKLVSEQAPPKKVKKTKTKTVVSLDKKKEKIDNQNPEAVPLPDKTVKKIETKKETKQNPEKVDNEVKQVSEFEKKDLFDPNNIAALIDKSKIEDADNIKKNNDITQDQDRNIESNKLTLSEEDALKAQIFGCWSIPLGLPYNEDLLVRIKLKLEPDGSVAKTEILDHARMNQPGQSFYKVLAESALRAVKLCQPLRVPSTGYERWKDLQLNFDAREMLEG
ncbi:cell envelope biogenesis protein TolA [Candidatus Pelagibacter sp.]|nr:cell envelope biogenesis protein TolA [Candidatus Pelagibacter sp.]